MSECDQEEGSREEEVGGVVVPGTRSPGGHRHRAPRRTSTEGAVTQPSLVFSWMTWNWVAQAPWQTCPNTQIARWVMSVSTSSPCEHKLHKLATTYHPQPPIKPLPLISCLKGAGLGGNLAAEVEARPMLKRFYENRIPIRT